MANVLVNARGLNSFPSAASMAKTGRKLTTVVVSAVMTAGATSVAAVYITEVSFCPRAPLFSGSSRCRTMFSVKTTPTSTITPMAIAIPDKATMLASTPKLRITMKVISTPMGSKLDIRNEALRFITRIITTIILMRISSDRASSSVPRVS